MAASTKVKIFCLPTDRWMEAASNGCICPDVRAVLILAMVLLSSANDLGGSSASDGVVSSSESTPFGTRPVLGLALFTVPGGMPFSTMAKRFKYDSRTGAASF